MPAILVILLFVFISCQGQDLAGSSYSCSNGYEIAFEEPDTLVVNGRRIKVYRVKSASGVKYGTEQGLKPDHGLIWWSKGSEASLFENVLDHTASAGENPAISECVLKGI